MVSLSVVAHHCVPPELVGEEGPHDGGSVVDLVVVADPGTDESPHGLPGGVSAQSRNLGGLASYKVKKAVRKSCLRADLS